MHLHTSRHKISAFAATATMAALALAGCSAAAPEASTPSVSSTAPTATTATESPSSSSTPSATAAAAAATTEQQAAEPKTHTIANGHFTLAAPASWTLKEKKLEDWQVHRQVATNLSIQNRDGQEMAVLQTGGDLVGDLTIVPEGQAFTQLDSAEAAVASKSFFGFDALGKGGNEATIGLRFYDLTGAEELESLAPLFSYEDGSGVFYRGIDKDEALTGVPASIKGLDRLETYAKSDEYAQLKDMMLSFKPTKKLTAAAGPCIGAKYVYDLTGSGLSCDEAKSFVQQGEGQRPSAGAIEIGDLGYCEIKEPSICTISATGKTFSYRLK